MINRVFFFLKVALSMYVLVCFEGVIVVLYLIALQDKFAISPKNIHLFENTKFCFKLL